jgi:hypothetical protein
VEKALAQVNDEEFFRKPGAESPSIAVLVKQFRGGRSVAGSLAY